MYISLHVLESFDDFENRTLAAKKAFFKTCTTLFKKYTSSRNTKTEKTNLEEKKFRQYKSEKRKHLNFKYKICKIQKAQKAVIQIQGKKAN